MTRIPPNVQTLIDNRDPAKLSLDPLYQILNKMRGQHLDAYHTMEIDLSVARDLEEHPISGWILNVTASDSDDTTANVDVRLNRSSNKPINFKWRYRLISPFERIFLTNTAQSGKSVTLAWASEPLLFDLEIPDLSDADIKTSVDNVEKQLKGNTTTPDYGRVQCSSAGSGTEILDANTSRAGFRLYNPPGNDFFDIGYDTNLSTTKYGRRLYAGQELVNTIYQGIVQARANTNNEWLHYEEFVV